MLPSFVCIGAPRAGTTWLFENLRHHSAIYLPDFKEVNYFRTQHLAEPYLESGLAGYEKVFVGAEGCVAGDISPDLLSALQAPRRLRLALPDAKLIVLLRDPVERAVSHFNFVRGRGGITKSPQRFFRSREAARVLGDGLYGTHLQAYLREFPRSQIHVAFSRDIRTAPEALLEDICRFIGVEPKADRARAKAHINAPRSYRFPRLYRLQREASELLHRKGFDGLRRRIKGSGPLRAYTRLTVVEGAKAWKPSLEERQQLERYYQEDQRLLAELLGAGLPWAPETPAAVANS